MTTPLLGSDMFFCGSGPCDPAYSREFTRKDVSEYLGKEKQH